MVAVLWDSSSWLINCEINIRTLHYTCSSPNSRRGQHHLIAGSIFVFYYHMDISLQSRERKLESDQEQTDFNRRARERLQDTPHGHLRASEGALASLRPAGRSSSASASIFQAAAPQDWNLCLPKRVVSLAPRSSCFPFHFSSGKPQFRG